MLEKPEKLESEGLGFVRSSNAARLKRIKAGFWQPPGGPPVFVPGLHWLCLLVLGHSGPPTVALMRWWNNRDRGSVPVTEPRRLREEVLEQWVRAWGQRVLHMWDSGNAGRPWLGLAEGMEITRWDGNQAPRLTDDARAALLKGTVSAGRPPGDPL